ncbi:hypothetical protein WN51_04151 [Melipona quadrifasciata]|uniref:Uncharacterized protein n=1 Tax=Melipona quadrifasciata TaxID=166423 RepID=A0A0M8ZPW0_9HYME|nr:hypothetical protein WN51_04151 [Melipona quadrifasciata]
MSWPGILAGVGGGHDSFYHLPQFAFCSLGANQFHPSLGGAYVSQLHDIDDKRLTQHILWEMLSKTGFCCSRYADKLFPYRERIKFRDNYDQCSSATILTTFRFHLQIHKKENCTLKSKIH